MKTIIKLNEETIKIFRHGTIVQFQGEEYSYFPFWLKKTENENEFEMLYLDNLPERLVSEIHNMRGQYSSFKEDVLQYPIGKTDAFYEKDELFEQAAILILEHDCGSVSLLQRKLKLGYHKAGKIMDQLEAHKIVGPFQGAKAREILFKNIDELKCHLELIK